MRQYDALVRRSNELRDVENHRAGVIASCVANSVRSSDSDHVWTPSDFFPSLEVYEPEPDTPNLWNKIVRTFAMFGMKRAQPN